ncbi:MAG: hypothetical protein AAFR22_16000 [Chloroflexota bacterium]
MHNTSILSRHRLPQPYRTAIVVLWVLPSVILFGALLVGNGFTLAVLHPMVLLALVAMAAPALDIWHEGIDVTETGLRIRIGGWRTVPFEHLDTYYLHDYRGGRLLKLWDRHNRRVLTVYAAHLTDLPVLLRTLKARLRWRGWPE